jgi:hypothetical protein
MINWMVFDVSLPYPSYEFLILFCKYWAIQSAPAIIMLDKLNKLLDRRVNLRPSNVERVKKRHSSLLYHR